MCNEAYFMVPVLKALNQSNHLQIISNEVQIEPVTFIPSFFRVIYTGVFVVAFRIVSE